MDLTDLADLADLADSKDPQMDHGSAGMEAYSMYASTVQACVLKVLFDSLRELLVDTVIQFSPAGVKLVDLDNTHVVMLNLRLDAKNFEEFHCDADGVAIGVNVANLHALLKTVNTNDTLTLFLERADSNRLGISVQNDEKRTKTEFKLNLLDIDAAEYNIPPVGFNSCIVLPSTYLQKIVRDMSNLSEQVEIRNVGRELVLICNGHFCRQETVLQDTEIGEAPDGGDGAENHDATLIKQGVFSLRYLSMFTKCSSLAPNVEIYLKNAFPLVLRFNISLGELKLCLSPIQTDDSY